MTPDRATLEARFAALADDALLHELASGDLAALESIVAQAEAGRRGLYLQALRAGVEAEGVEVARGHGPLRICARYFLPLDAQVLAARLQAEGLAARVMDSDAGYASGDIGSMGTGGVRVMVPESQLGQALRIRERFDAGEFAIDENFDPNADPP
jgi:hypothetical protein